MGIYLNPGYVNFKEMISARIYVDKTMMISAVNKLMDEGDKYICMSRPRRFGKTIASEMLSAYFSKECDTRELFAPFKIAHDPSFETNLNRYNVIKIDWNYEYQKGRKRDNLFVRFQKEVVEEMIDAFPDVKIREDDFLADAIQKVYAKTGETFVILMDEYDVFIREQVSEELFSEYLSLLNALFKSATLRPAISLAYLTGILPVVRDKVQSKLNNFREYTILDALSLAEYVGFTTEEVKSLCDEYNMDFDECRQWYDGYAQHGYEIYNPESVVMSMIAQRYGNYWNRTSSYEVISDRIREDFEGTRECVIRMLAGERVDVNVTAFLNTMNSFHTRNDVFTYLIHLGYLAYNLEDGTCRIPNREVKNEWINALEIDPNYAVTNRIIEASKQLLADTIAGDTDAVAHALDESHIHVTSNRSYNNEDALGSAIYLAFIYALNDYTCVREMTAGSGFADIVYIPVHPGNPDRPAMILELKRNDSVQSAIDQIRDKQYFKSLEHYYGQLLFVGIDYDEKEKTHTCRMEWFTK